MRNLFRRPRASEPAPGDPAPTEHEATTRLAPGIVAGQQEPGSSNAGTGAARPMEITSNAGPAGRVEPRAPAQNPPGAVAAEESEEPARDRLARSSPGDAIVVLDRLGKDFGGGVGVQDISMLVDPGSIVGVVGPSGAGKTTVIRLITGALAPSSGSVSVLGSDPRRFSRATRERIGYMPQLFTLYPDLTADENVDFVASLFGLLWGNRRRRVREVLELVELWDARKRRAGKLSGGMQRRLELACALVHEPELLLLDEPSAGIDPILRETIWAELHRLRDHGRTLLVTTQYVTEAEGCDSVALIADGRLVALGPPETLRRKAAGGDVIEVTTEEPFDPDALAGHPGVHSVETRGLRSFRASVDDAGAMLPVIDDVVAEAGGHVNGAREVRLTFDEVFADLVEQSRNGQDGNGQDGNGNADGAVMSTRSRTSGGGAR
jgi:ABC-2 type transport system ATP-binding protein